MAQEGYGAAAAYLRVAETELRRLSFVNSQSSLGDAQYWSRGADGVRIRTATYHHSHDATVDLTITPEFTRARTLTAGEIVEMVAQAVRLAERMAAEIAAEHDDDDAELDEMSRLTPAEVQRRLRGAHP